ncbi:reverse transcriptase domain-containing protein [Tanacetum coccineum]
MVPATTSLTGFSGETIWPLGQLRLLVTIGDADHSTTAWMNFMIVRSLSPYNGIIGRPGIREIQAVPSTAHEMLKFPADRGIMTIRSTILIPVESATVTTSSKEIPKEARVHHENFKVAPHPNFPDQEVAIEGTLSAKGRTKLGQALKRAKAIQAEVQKLVDVGIMREVYYHDWLSNPVLVKKHEGSWWMCVDFTNLNKACPQDCYPLPEIDWKVESLYGYPFKCFLDTYKGYHQIQMAESDEEKTAFHTSQGVYCYTKMPFGLKNAGATYQRLVDKAVDNQVGQNIELFLSKSAEKYLPLLKTLKKCIKKSDFHWTPEAEQAFKQLKQHLSEPPLLVVPKPKEELIVYLSASLGAISAGPELNYTPMEKLVISLVFAAKRLRRSWLKYLKNNPYKRGEVATVVEKEGPTWMTTIMEYLKDGTLPGDRKEANKLRIKARQYELLDGILYKRSFLKSWLRCVGPLQADYVIREIHEGSCNIHAGPWSVVAKAMRLGYYWPTMHRDARDMIRTCNDCQIHLPVPRNPQQPLTPITAPWPFYKWGIDIAGPFPEGPRKVKFLIVAMDYFTK